MTKWISVKERLPEEYKTVPFVVDGEIFYGELWPGYWLIPGAYSEPDSFPLDHVTHWAEIEPPEVE